MDLRVSSGWFFVLTGVLVLAMGLFSPARPRLMDVNVNLYTGAFMILFGGVLLLASRGRRG